MLRIITIVGARPQFIKAAPLSKAIARHSNAREKIVHTGQHYDAAMSDTFFDELNIPTPAYHLNINGGGHGSMTGRMLSALEPVFLAEKPDIVLVYGDTNSTLAASLAAAKLGIPIAHVEAGLRSRVRTMPEEINRVLTDHVSRWLFCPTRLAVKNLAAEGIADHVYHVGDVMMDVANLVGPIADRQSDIRNRLGLNGQRYGVVTLHRAENTNDPARLGELLKFLRRTAMEQKLVFPVHPRTREAAARMGLDLEGFCVCGPLGYIDFTALVRGADCIYTDSGGLQKEAYFHGVPCVTLREETEWHETIEAGWNRLWRKEAYMCRTRIDDFGTGQAAERIAEILIRSPAVE